jgi:hypothetical protein
MNIKEKIRNYTNIGKLNNMLLNDHWIIEEIKSETFKILELDENKNTTYQSM